MHVLPEKGVLMLFIAELLWLLKLVLEVSFAIDSTRYEYFNIGI